MDIEGYHGMLLSRDNTSATKRVIVKFVSRKQSEGMLRLEKITSSPSKVFISNLLCPYYRCICSKCKDLQQKSIVNQVFCLDAGGIVNQVFCLRAVVTIKPSENGTPVKIYHENDLKVYQGNINASDGE